MHFSSHSEFKITKAEFLSMCIFLILHKKYTQYYKHYNSNCIIFVYLYNLKKCINTINYYRNMNTF